MYCIQRVIKFESDGGLVFVASSMSLLSHRKTNMKLVHDKYNQELRGHEQREGNYY